MARLPSRDRGLHEGVLYAFLAFLARLVLCLFHRYRILGAHHVPARGPVIVAANHSSYLDPIVVGAGILRRSCYLARETLFRRRAFGWLIRGVGALPLPRESRSPREALEVSLGVLERERVLVLFPEGTRSRTGRMGPFRKGAAWIARRSRAPVVPCRVEGSFAAWPRGRNVPRSFPLRVVYGTPILYGEGETADAFLERLRRAIEELAPSDPGEGPLEWGPAPAPATSVVTSGVGGERFSPDDDSQPAPRSGSSSA